MKQCLVCGKGFEPPAGRGRPPETCSPEHAAIRKRQHREASRKKATQRGLPPGHELHGTSTGYTYYNCHCDDCREWARTYKAHQRDHAKEVAIPT